jgi:uncharacterized protein with GYD domain
VKVLSQYATLGAYDFVNIIEAPDNKTVVKVSVELWLEGNRRDYYASSNDAKRIRRHSERLARDSNTARPEHGRSVTGRTGNCSNISA